MSGDGIIVLKQKYDAAVMSAAEDGLPALPPFHEWIKQQEQPTLATITNPQ